VDEWRSAASQFLLVFVVVLKRLMTACAGLAAGCLDPVPSNESQPFAITSRGLGCFLLLCIFSLYRTLSNNSGIILSVIPNIVSFQCSQPSWEFLALTKALGITDYPCRSCSQPTRFTAFPKFWPGEDNFMPVCIPPVNKELIEEHEKSPEKIGFDSFSFSSQKGAFIMRM